MHRDKKGIIHFNDYPEFQPNLHREKSLKREVLEEPIGDLYTHQLLIKI